MRSVCETYRRPAAPNLEALIVELAEAIELTLARWKASPARRYSAEVAVIDAATWGEHGAWMVTEVGEELLARFDSWALVEAMESSAGLADRLLRVGWQVPETFVEQMALPIHTWDPPVSVNRSWVASEPGSPRAVALAIVQALALVWDICDPAEIVYATTVCPPEVNGRCEGPWWPPDAPLR